MEPFFLLKVAKSVGSTPTGQPECTQTNVTMEFTLHGTLNGRACFVSNAPSQESRTINRSLLTLGRVLNFYATGNTGRVPFLRDSKLTRCAIGHLHIERDSFDVCDFFQRNESYEETVPESRSSRETPFSQGRFCKTPAFFWPWTPPITTNYYLCPAGDIECG